MPGWSNIFGLDLTSPEDREGFDATSRRIHTIVQAEIDRGVPPERVVVGGFSQGGAAALHFSLRCPHALGGVVAFSTWLPLRSDYPGALSPFAAHTPILFCHGTQDYIVDYSYTEQMTNTSLIVLL